MPQISRIHMRPRGWAGEKIFSVPTPSPGGTPTPLGVGGRGNCFLGGKGGYGGIGGYI